MMTRFAARLANLGRRFTGGDDAPKALFFYPQEGSNDTCNAAREAVHRLADEMPDATPEQVVEVFFARHAEEHPDYVDNHAGYWAVIVRQRRASTAPTTPANDTPTA